MCLSITARFEMNRRANPASANRKDSIASLVRPFVDTKALAAKCEHLRHEGHIFQAAIFPKRRQDFLAAANLYPFSGLQVEFFDSAWIVHLIVSRLLDAERSSACYLELANNCPRSRGSYPSPVYP
jgi:hypothetical protein